MLGVRVVVGICGHGLRLDLDAGLRKQVSADRELLGSTAVGQQAVVPDAHESTRQHVHQETPEEFRSVERHDALLATSGIVLVPEADSAVLEGDEAAVANGHTVGVAGQIFQYDARPRKWRFCVGPPSRCLSTSCTER
ncbi:MAG: hypothetical protein A2289_24260 [Deltaproteobacteria bacterium RIFOXYA12_FULL_58_15]|nr:MAG: hypothetical protein A2289_24260 [Deltaproteobacteria bacterium RIFOXYA12_FULL_58_15]OGR15279.1 MAG: hypothetical protein A2341_23280 [Deltaproteobacteria bacterium RIFOXYB12_FULL_58_9]